MLQWIVCGWCIAVCNGTSSSRFRQAPEQATTEGAGGDRGKVGEGLEYRPYYVIRCRNKICKTVEFEKRLCFAPKALSTAAV